MTNLTKSGQPRKRRPGAGRPPQDTERRTIRLPRTSWATIDANRGPLSPSEYIRTLMTTVKRLEIQLAAARAQHQFCPDCRDKVKHESCLRCQVQALQRKLNPPTK